MGYASTDGPFLYYIMEHRNGYPVTNCHASNGVNGVNAHNAENGGPPCADQFEFQWEVNMICHAFKKNL